MIIYKVINLINGKCYIGKTIFLLEKRKYIHNISKDNCYFHRAIRKYGKENFQWEILKNNINDELILNIMETFMIMVHHSHISENGYNMTWGGEGSFGRKQTEETKKKISEKRKGKCSGKDNPMHGKKRPDLSLYNKLYPKSGEKNGNYHREFTEQHKKNISMAHKGKIVSDEVRIRLQTMWIGKKHSEETKKKISKSMLDVYRKRKRKRKENEKKCTF